MTGYCFHLVMQGGLGRSGYCFHCCSIWLHRCTESDSGWPQCSMHETLLGATILFFLIEYKVFEWLPRPQAAAAAIRAILAWVSSLTSVHSSQHCWCNWPLENINHRLQRVEKANPDLFTPMFTVMTSVNQKLISAIIRFCSWSGNQGLYAVRLHGRFSAMPYKIICMSHGVSQLCERNAGNFIAKHRSHTHTHTVNKTLFFCKTWRSSARQREVKHSFLTQ